MNIFLKKRASKQNEKPECQKEKDKIEIERITSSVLDTLLHDLHKSGIINDDTKSDIVQNESIQKIERPTTAPSPNSKSRESRAHSARINMRQTIDNDVESSISTKVMYEKYRNIFQWN